MSRYFECCNKCGDRKYACHDSCEKYQSAKRKHLNEQREIGINRRREANADAAQREAVKRCIKSRKR